MHKKRNLILLAVLALTSAGVFWLYQNKSSKSFEDSFADFSVKDTASIDKIIISDTEGKMITLKRKAGFWSLNDSLEARPELINLALGAFRDVIIQSPIGAKAKENTIRFLAARHKQVQIFQNGSDTPTKIWYVGDANQSHFGTTLLQEIPGKGKADQPYIIELPWHKGFITPFFYADYLEWMATPVFRYRENDFKNITVQLYAKPEGSFSIDRVGRFYTVRSLASGKPLQKLDSLFVKDYIKGYEKLYFECYDKLLSPQQEDSVLQTSPLYRIAVTENDGQVNEIKIYRKKAPSYDMEGELSVVKYDVDRYNGYYKNRFVMVQHYAFDKLLAELKNFGE